MCPFMDQRWFSIATTVLVEIVGDRGIAGDQFALRVYRGV